jgi:hypothetical protein
MTKAATVWAVPVLLALHNVEEALTFPRYLERVRGHEPWLMRELAGSVDNRALFGALLIVTVVPLLVSLWSWLRPESKAAFWCVMLIQATVFLNVFAHLASATAIFRGYGPGLLTALAINLPFSIYLFRRARREKWLSQRESIWLVPAAILVHGPGLIAAFAVAKAF